MHRRFGDFGRAILRQADKDKDLAVAQSPRRKIYFEFFLCEIRASARVLLRGRVTARRPRVLAGNCLEEDALASS